MKFLRYFFLLLGAFIWFAGLNGAVFSFLGSANFFRDGYQFGDLYRLSNLPQFKDPKKECPSYLPAFKNTTGKKINLFIIGDSFTEPGRISGTDFIADSYQYIHWSETLHLKPDPSATNILLIECVERHVREKFSSPITNIIPDSATFMNKASDPGFMHNLDAAFSSKAKEERFDMMLFQNNVILAIKEWKAFFNYFFFDRVRNEVSLVNNDRDIVYFMDTDTIQNSKILKTTSSFTPLADAEVDTLALNIMKSTTTAKKMGFDHVILSIIPNKVSVVMPGEKAYNRLIERVYADTTLKLPVIDVLTDFRKMGRSSYLLGDSHWTCEGQRLWLDKVNAGIRQMIRPKP